MLQVEPCQNLSKFMADGDMLVRQGSRKEKLPGETNEEREESHCECHHLERVKIDSKPARDRRHLQNEHAEKRRPKPKPPISPIKDPLPPNLKPVLVKGTTDDRGETPLQNNR
ncbi:hypothetical protein V6N12_059974 [Hibiscus sabdariffa]|uniref:Uncharacterized protein n=1 Tax=Hibiscus sabdariffa TaxID=183260 RepID=A0ABR2D330_9ROSI